MRGEEHREEMRRLLADGVRRVDVAAQFGLRESDVWKVLNSERHRESMRKSNARRAAAKREWDAAHRKPCDECGKPTKKPPGRNAARLCWECHVAEKNERTAERGHEIEAWWAEGLTIREIAERLDTTPGFIGVEINRLRLKGFDLPYRYKTYNGKRVAA